ncbi:MAG: hypothetical protein ACLQIQ_20490 [Beijerinckiaceae bacterium]
MPRRRVTWLAIIAIFAAVSASSRLICQERNGAEEERNAVIPSSWLQEKISVAEAEAAHPGVNDERLSRHPELAKPFGGLNRQWEALKSEMEPGDEIWTFSNPADYWEHLAGRAGVALVRHGKAVKTIVTLMN